MAGTKWRSIATAVIYELVAGAGLLIDGLRIKDASIKPAAGGAAFIDLTDCATGEGDILLADNLAEAMQTRQGTKKYTTHVTTNDKEAFVVHTVFRQETQAGIIDMAGATHELTLGTAVPGTSTKLLCNDVFVDANQTGGGSSAQSLKLPDATFIPGAVVRIYNVGGETLNIKDKDGANTLINSNGGLAIAAGKIGVLQATASGQWFGLST